MKICIIDHLGLLVDDCVSNARVSMTTYCARLLVLYKATILCRRNIYASPINVCTKPFFMSK